MVIKHCVFIFRWRLLTTALLLSLGLSNAAVGKDNVIRITLARSVNDVPLWGIAPFAKKYGLKVDFIPALNNAEMLRNLESGVEVGTVGYQTPAIMADQHISDVRIIAGIQTGLANLVMRSGVSLKSWKDLEGKSIGWLPGSWVAILFSLAAQQHDVDLAKVHLVHIATVGPAELRALKNSELDGIILWSPMVDRAVVESLAYYPACCDIGSTAKFGGGNQILAASTGFLKNHSGVVKFLKAYTESLHYYADNPTEAINLIVQYTGAPPDIIRESFKHGNWDVRLDLAAMENVAREGPTLGFAKRDTSADIAHYVDLKPLAEALGRPTTQLSTLH